MSNRHVFDGFCHRPFSEALDGWRDALSPAADFPCVAQAHATLDLFNALRTAEKRVWQLERENEMLRNALGWPVTSSPEGVR